MVNELTIELRRQTADERFQILMDQAVKAIAKACAAKGEKDEGVS